MVLHRVLFTPAVGTVLGGLLVCCPARAAAQTSSPSGRYGEPTAVCEINDRRLTEASGLAASHRNPDLYYTHNDSQGRPEVYALDRSGHVRTTIRLVGARNVDWEDLALAPGEKPGTYDVCVADIGDNNAKRAEIVIYRFPEPDLRAATGPVVDVKPQRFRCKYEDGPQNAEGFAVHPGTGDGYVFTKQWYGACRVYRLGAPWTAIGVTTLKCVGSLRFPEKATPPMIMVTAADISPDGRRLVTRGYLGGWEWHLPEAPDAAALARAFRQEPTALRLATEPQGEALCFSADGRVLLTLSEKRPTTLYEVRVVENPRSGQP